MINSSKSNKELFKPILCDYDRIRFSFDCKGSQKYETRTLILKERRTTYYQIQNFIRQFYSDKLAQYHIMKNCLEVSNSYIDSDDFFSEEYFCLLNHVQQDMILHMDIKYKGTETVDEVRTGHYVVRLKMKYKNEVPI